MLSTHWSAMDFFYWGDLINRKATLNICMLISRTLTEDALGYLSKYIRFCLVQRQSILTWSFNPLT